MAGWFFVRGRADEQTLSEVTAAGVKTIALTGADQIFSIGQPLLISEADGVETQWLGKATAVGPASVSFARPLESSKNSGAKLWRAQAVLETPAEVALPERRRLETGVVTEQVRGGDFYAVKVAEPRTEVRLGLRGLTRQTEQALFLWLGAHAEWGLQPFTLISPGGELIAVRLSGDPIEQEREAGGRRAMTLQAVIVGVGMYQ